MRIGIDLGGTKIEGLALADDGRELARTRMPSPRGNYGDTLAAIVTVVESLERAAGSRGSVGSWNPRCTVAGHRSGEECQLDLAEWPTARR
jgi:hypothetical protein